MKSLARLFSVIGASLLLVLVLAAAAANVPTRKLKHVGRPIVALAMNGPRVVYSTDDNAVRVWNIRSGTSTELRRGAGRFTDNPSIPEVASAGARAAWITLAVAGNSQETWARLHTASLTRPGSRMAAAAFRTDGYSDEGVELWDGDWLTGLVGSGNVLAVSRWTTTPKPDLSGSTI